MTMKFALKKGQKIGIASTGSPVNPQRMAAGLAVLRELGYDPVVPVDPSLYYSNNSASFGCWSKDEKLAVLHQLFLDQEVSAIICARGGYSTQEILPFVDFDLLRAHPKPLVGFSDCTPLLLNAQLRSGVPAIHGPALAVEFADYHENQDAKRSVDELLDCLRGERNFLEFSLQVERAAITAGPVSGPLIGGNLSMLASAVGTPWDVSFDGAVLFVEDVGEAPYRVHRLFTQLAFAGKLRNLAALVFGEFVNSQAGLGPTIEATVEMVIRDLMAGSLFPVLRGLPVGHDRRNSPMPLGNTAEVLGGKLIINFGCKE